MGSKHLESRSRNEDKSTDIQIFLNDFSEEDIYDNRPSSTVLNRARTNTIQLTDRKKTHK